jgi:predicted transcriptional regulator
MRLYSGGCARTTRQGAEHALGVWFGPSRRTETEPLRPDRYEDCSEKPTGGSFLPGYGKCPHMNSELTAREIMDREYVGVTQSDALIETVELLLAEDKETAVVLHGSEHVGVVTERDILSTLVDGPDPSEATVGDVMSEHVPTVSPETTLSAAADQLSTGSARRLVVTAGTEPEGVITQDDLIVGRNYSLEQETTPAATGEGLAEGTVGGAGTTTTPPAEEGFEDQGICEVCGTLARDLMSVNGQLVCVDCREM